MVIDDIPANHFPKNWESGITKSNLFRI